MIPIWARNQEGHWQVFPTHMVKTYEDGAIGYDYRSTLGNIQYMIFERAWLHLFKYDRANHRFVLKKQS